MKVLVLQFTLFNPAIPVKSVCAVDIGGVSADTDTPAGGVVSPTSSIGAANFVFNGDAL